MFRAAMTNVKVSGADHLKVMLGGVYYKVYTFDDDARGRRWSRRKK